MARAGLGASWRCLFANDFDAGKVATYEANWGPSDITLADVASLGPADLPSRSVDLAWASFPCQDLSLAGGQGGLGREHDQVTTRSGAFWPFWNRARARAGWSRATRDRARERPRLPDLARGPGFRGDRSGAGRVQLPVRSRGDRRRPFRAPIAASRFFHRHPRRPSGSGFPDRRWAAANLASRSAHQGSRRPRARGETKLDLVEDPRTAGAKRDLARTSSKRRRAA